MAIWQWSFFIVPRNKVLEHFNAIPQFVDLEWFESIAWWESLSETYINNSFDELLPRYEAPWAKNTTCWGNLDGDRIHVRVVDETIVNLALRIDLRHLDFNLLDSLTDFAKANDLLFYILETSKFIEPNMDDLTGEIKNSRKIGFLQDPEKFFDDKGYLDKINKENRRKIDKGI